MIRYSGFERIFGIFALSTLFSLWIGTILPFDQGHDGQERKLIIGLFGVAAFYAAAIVVGGASPVLTARSFEPSEVLPKDMQDCVDGLLDRAKTVRIHVLMNRRIFSTEARVFGYPFYKRLGLGGGSRLLIRRDLDAFRAVVAHELGHARGLDVLWASLGLGAVTSVSMLAIGGLTINGAVRGIRADLWHPVVGVVIFAALILLEYRQFIRTREFYADAFAAQIVGQEVLSRALAKRPKPPGRLNRLLSFHPPSATRISKISHPDGLTRPSGLDFFRAGIYFGILASAMVLLDKPIFGNGPIESFEQAHAFLKASSANLWATVAITVSFLGVVALVAVQSVRLGLSIVGCERSLISGAFFIVLLPVAFCFGAVVGMVISPFDFFGIESGGLVRTLPGLDDINLFIVLFASIVAANFLVSLLALILRSKNDGYSENRLAMYSLFWASAFIKTILIYFLSLRPESPPMLVLIVSGVVQLALEVMLVLAVFVAVKNVLRFVRRSL